MAMLLSVIFMEHATTALAAQGDTIRVSVHTDGSEANSWSEFAAISADGRYVAFTSFASNLVDNDNTAFDVFVHDTQSSATTRVSVDSEGNEANGSSSLPAISAGGGFIAFHSDASNLVDNDNNGSIDVFVHDTHTGDTTRVSVDTAGTEGNGTSALPSISADGRFVAFHSFADNLVENDNNAQADVFLHDTLTGTTTRVSVHSDGTEGNFMSLFPSISANGMSVAFESLANTLVDNDNNLRQDVFVHDTQTGVTTRVSVDSAGIEGNDTSYSASASADGRFVAFSSDATNLITDDNTDNRDIFVHDRETGATSRASIRGDDIEVLNDSFGPSISGDGRFVAFHSQGLFIDDDNNEQTDVFVHDTQTANTSRISVRSDGTEALGGSSDFAAISSDGRFVAFESEAVNLVDNDTNGWGDVFVHQFGVDHPPPSTTSTTTSTTSSTPPDPSTTTPDSTTTTPSSTTTTRTTTTPATTTTTRPPLATFDWFRDDNGHLFEKDINSIATTGITRGCNPPDNDRYCPDRTLTRAEAAAFVARALGLPKATTDWFTDDNGLTLEPEINRLAEAGVTRGCNPPANDQYCPGRTLTRAEAAAFLARALNLPAAVIDWFTDDDGLTLEPEINRLAEEGITRGCNPPVNTMYCPNDNLTRGQGAAFLNRALLK